MNAPATPWRWLQTAIAQAAVTLDRRKTFTAPELLEALRMHCPALLRGGLSDGDALALIDITHNGFRMPSSRVVGDLLIAYQQLPEGVSDADLRAAMDDVIGRHRLTGPEQVAIISEFLHTLRLWGEHALRRADELEVSSSAVIARPKGAP